MSEGKVIIIGISGATNTGKTSLCSLLSEKFPQACTLHQDDYFLEEHQLNWVDEVNHANWDEISATDNEMLLNDMKNWKEAATKSDSKSNHLLLVEGFLIFNYKPLIPMFDKKYFMDLPETECRKRRVERVYVPPDPPLYFEKVVYPMYVKNRQDMTMMNNDDIEIIDGCRTQESILQQIIKDINQLL